MPNVTLTLSLFGVGKTQFCCKEYRSNNCLAHTAPFSSCADVCMSFSTHVSMALPLQDTECKQKRNLKSQFLWHKSTLLKLVSHRLM